jgi:alpha/beta superfamily hydrolase
MVLPNQYLERPAVIACGDLALEGLYHRGARAPAALICPAPGPGGGMDAPPVAELAFACARAGHASLRFQHRGVGASGGEPDEARATEDAVAALAHLAETAGARELAVMGFAAGCETALAVARADERVVAVVLVAPTAEPGLDGVRARVLVIVPEQGAPAGGGTAGARVEVIQDADPLFVRGLTAMARAAVGFVGR